ncbi:hypothetical protein PANDA_007090 [Ailuropoda melanoleuca]|uniref:Uncharacterized protein n=1 Tax=Ailuropoda melanoleuca TaxID=9646 RepID=D2H9R6_AILME|nr:hypothetical protein PANDA_007090 [Ailuropoda melanoleuca]
MAPDIFCTLGRGKDNRTRLQQPPGLIEGDISTEIEGDISTEIEGGISTEIEGDISTEIEGDISTEIEGDISTEIEGGISTEIEGDISTEIEGDISTEIEGDISTEIEGDISTEIEGDISTEIEGDISTEIEGDISSRHSLLTWEMFCFSSMPQTFGYLLLSKTGNEEFKASKSLEKDREREYGFVGTPCDAVVPNVLFTTKGLLINATHSHLCFMISCFMSNRTRRWVVSPEYLVGICQRAYTSGDCLDEFCVNTSVLPVQKA